MGVATSRIGCGEDEKGSGNVRTAQIRCLVAGRPDRARSRGPCNTSTEPSYAGATLALSLAGLDERREVFIMSSTELKLGRRDVLKVLAVSVPFGAALPACSTIQYREGDPAEEVSEQAVQSLRPGEQPWQNLYLPKR